ncbi:MAG TPA: thioredoxin domain-containing protein, partial [Opitutaceae bacterium]|nr:thioredoxin domain-containing protein [Opitutaceae bacterium]
MPNRLASATSPYLLQHADNPVDWRPWGAEAFAAARELDRPIFLSIGYSTCHWCHVMAHESFENEAVAAVLNASFVPIKLDREERPDVDRVYMAYLQALTGQGGWPLSAWLTPDLKPFYVGTYFPPEDRHGRAGFPTVLRAIARGWREDRAKLVEEGERVVQSLRENAAQEAAPAGRIDATLAQAAGAAFERAYQYYAESFDQANGGFGGAPKFPRPANLAFLLRCAAVQGVSSEAGAEAAGMVARTLGGMARGGIHDHVGGGFHRYSVDAEWFMPHFEKMLYDQAQVASCALDAWRATGDERPAWLARATLDYVLRDMTSPEGAFYSAEDADSPRGEGQESVEGAFYVWTTGELEDALGPDAAFLAGHYGAMPGGNVPPGRDPHGEFTGRNILAQVRPLSETARLGGMEPQAASDLLVSCLGRLLAARSRRRRPHLDDKVVAGWNGLMISALARAASAPAQCLADRRRAYLEAALRAAAFAVGALLDLPGGLPRRSWRAGAGSGPGFAEDCAFLIQAWLDLYEATFDTVWLDRAERLQGAMDAEFWDAGGGGYFNSSAGAADVLVRLKEDYDGAEPAATSAAALNLFRLSSLTGDMGLRERGRRAIAAFRGRWEPAPHAMPQLLCAFESALEPPRHVVLTGDPGSADFAALSAAAQEGLGP